MFIDDMETEGIPERILQIMRALELDTMLDICRRIKLAGEITSTADYQIERMRQLSAFRGNYEKMIKKVLDLTDEQLHKLYDEAIPKGYIRDKALYEAAGAEWIPFEENESLQQLINAVLKQTQDQIRNITQTTGFVNMSNGRSEALSQYFINLMDKAHMEIATGTFSYDQALHKAVSDMAMSGMRWIDYQNDGKKPWHNRIDVAARRAVMTGLVQVEGKIADDNAEKLDTEYFEVSAHATARPSHMVWQGKVYTKEQLVSICGLGTGPGLLGWNCYHHYDAFIPGVSVRKYSDDDLAEMRKKALQTKEWKGKKYTLYEATQKQRKLETAMRAANEQIEMLKAGGASKTEISLARIRRNDLYKEYRAFSKEFDLPEQINRVYTGINDRTSRNAAVDTGSGTAPTEPATPAVSSIPHEDVRQLPSMSSASDIPGTVDNTWQWQHEENGIQQKCEEIGNVFDFKGVKYVVDGKHVKYTYDDHELHIGKVIAEYYHKRVWMLPKIDFPPSTETPDYFVDTIGHGYDLKTITGNGKKTLKEAVRKKKKQAQKFILDITNTPMSDEKIKQQVFDIFHSPDTAFVIEIVLMKNDRVIKSYKRG